MNLILVNIFAPLTVLSFYIDKTVYIFISFMVGSNSSLNIISNVDKKS